MKPINGTFLESMIDFSAKSQRTTRLRSRYQPYAGTQKGIANRTIQFPTTPSIGQFRYALVYYPYRNDRSYPLKSAEAMVFFSWRLYKVSTVDRSETRIFNQHNISSTELDQHIIILTLQGQLIEANPNKVNLI